jgi:hypothetical protein
MDSDTYWEIWDIVSRNLLMDFDTEEEALDWVWEVIRGDGIGATFELALGSRPGSADQALRGSALAERAFRRAVACAEREATAV